MGMSHKGFGRGKLLLFGEHAAVMGYPALGLALDRGIGVELDPKEKDHNWVLEGRGEKEGEMAREVMRRINAAVAGLPMGGRIRVRSELPEGRGFGSSAALCVALAEAALRAAGSPEVVRHRLIVWAIAHHAEGFFHGSPSGIDTGLAALGGLVAFRPAPPELPDWRRLPLRHFALLVGSVPRETSAKALIADIRQRSTEGASREASLLAQLGAISEAAEGLFEGGSAEQSDLSRKGGSSDDGRPHRWGGGADSSKLSYELGSLAREAQAELAELGLVEPALATLVKTGEAAGSPGGKMSGAGGGGAFWLVYPDPAAAGRGELALRQTAQSLGLDQGLSLEVLNIGG